MIITDLISTASAAIKAMPITETTNVTNSTNTQDLFIQILLTLTSGIIGSAIGALATVWATKKSIQATAEQASRLEEIREKRDEHQKIEQAKNWVHAEILQISEIVKEMPRKRKLPTNAWESTKMYFYWWKPEEQKALVNFYNEVEMFNTQVDFWVHGQGEKINANHPGQLMVSMQRVKPALKIVIEKLHVILS